MPAGVLRYSSARRRGERTTRAKAPAASPTPAAAAGYPRGLGGQQIPELARILSVADVYDVMTARDSYRQPVTPEEAIEELRLVAGTQLDARFVDIFVRLLDGRDVAFRHGVDADFDAELALERRVHAYAAGER